MNDMTPKSRTKRSCGGFTLVEVLIALGFLAVALIVLMRLLLISLQMTGHAGDYSRAGLAAEARMAETLSARKLEVGSQSGELEGDAGEPTLQWEGVVSDKSLSALDSLGVRNVREVKVRVSWGEGDGARSLEMVTLTTGQGRP